MLVNPDHVDSVETGRAADQHPLPFGQHRSVRGVPRNTQPLGDPGHAQVLAHDPFQGPSQPSAGDLRFRFGCHGGVLHPHVLAGGAPVAAHPDDQGGGPPPERCMGQSADPGIAGSALGSASVAGFVIINDSAFDDSAGIGDVLPGGGQC